jgi:hypothetical protein
VEPPTISDDFLWCGGPDSELAEIKIGCANVDRPRNCAPFSANSARKLAPRYDRAPLSAKFPRQFFCAILCQFCAVGVFWSGLESEPNDRNLLASNGFSSDCLKRVRKASESPPKAG